MREIKFRAWDKFREEWVYLPESGNIELIQYDESITFDCLPEIEIMQYTGLKDKNSKDIYEGDVWKRDSFVGQVIFEHCAWQIKKLPVSGCYQYPAFYSNANTGEVVGNIHENPELLEPRAPSMAQEPPQDKGRPQKQQLTGQVQNVSTRIAHWPNRCAKLQPRSNVIGGRNVAVQKVGF